LTSLSAVGLADGVPFFWDAPMPRITSDQLSEAHAANLYDLALQYGARLKRASITEYCGPCPICGGSDRFSVNVRKNIWNCRQCCLGGDPIAFVQHVDGVSFAEAVGRITGTGGSWTPTPPRRPIPPAPAPVSTASDNIESASRVWDGAGPIEGSPGEAYLAGRGIDLADVPNRGGLLWSPRCPWKGGVKPCIVARYTNALTGEPRGIWRRPINGEKPMSLGPTSGCVIRLWPDELIGEGFLALGEGVETTLAAATRLTFRGKHLNPAWAAGSSINMASFPALPGIEMLVLLVDHDQNGAGERASAEADIRWAAAGRQTMRLMPEVTGSDFNDMVRS
jgi:phage/plasmid primase-like uncharacterized protein